MKRVIGFLGFDSFESLLYAAHLFCAAGEAVVVVNYSHDAGIDFFSGATEKHSTVFRDITFCNTSRLVLEKYKDFSIALIALDSSSEQKVLDLCDDFVFSSDLIPWRKDSLIELSILESQDVVFIGFADKSYKLIAQEQATKIFDFVPPIFLVPFNKADQNLKLSLATRDELNLSKASYELKEALRGVVGNTLTTKQFNTAIKRKWR